MASRRSFPSATKASARFDLLSRVIFAAFTGSPLIFNLGLNPGLLADAADLALAEQTNPRGQEPAGDESAQANVDYLPGDHAHHPVGDGGPHNRVTRRQKEIVQPGDEEEPAETKEVRSDELLMGLKRRAQGFV